MLKTANKINVLSVIFIVLIVSGFLLSIIELIYSVQGTSICLTDGCAIVNSFIKNDAFLYYLGILFFVSLFILYIFKNKHNFVRMSLNILIILALIIEGYLIGFQIFIAENYCLTCLSIATIIILLSIINFIQQKEIMLIIGFVSLIFIPTLIWFINPGIKNLPKSEYIIIYSDKCKHCQAVIEYMKSKGINFQTVHEQIVKGFLKSANISVAPVLVANKRDMQIIINGKENIINYIKQQEQNQENVIKQHIQTDICNIFNKNDTNCY